VWAAGGEIAYVVTGSTQGTKIDAFTGNNTRFILMDKAAVQNAVKVYQTQYGKATIVPHRIMEQQLPQRALIFGEASFWKVAWLRKPKWQQLAKSGPSYKEFVECEYSLVCLNEKSSGQFKGT
jgi:hypothetical protein